VADDTAAAVPVSSRRLHNANIARLVMTQNVFINETALGDDNRRTDGVTVHGRKKNTAIIDQCNLLIEHLHMHV